MIDPNNAVVRLCTAGMEAEGRGDAATARASFAAAWDRAGTDYEACIAAHYLARHQPDAEATRHWNQIALDRADALAGDPRVAGFIPSLCLNLGCAHETSGRVAEAAALFERARAALAAVPDGRYRDLVAGGLERALARVRPTPTPPPE